MISIQQVMLAVALLSTFVSLGYVDGFRFPMEDNESNRGGREATIGKFPYSVSVQLKRHGMSYRHSCGGSIVSNRFILSVANCYDKQYKHRYRVLVGAHNLRKSGTAYAVEEWIVHLHFEVDLSQGNPTIKNNLAMIKTAKEIEFGALVSAIPLGNSYILQGGNAVVAGWGRKNVRFIRIDYENGFNIYAA